VHQQHGRRDLRELGRGIEAAPACHAPGARVTTMGGRCVKRWYKGLKIVELIGKWCIKSRALVPFSHSIIGGIQMWWMTRRARGIIHLLLQRERQSAVQRVYK
jgi:hypothetical protein